MWRENLRRTEFSLESQKYPGVPLPWGFGRFQGYWLDGSHAVLSLVFLQFLGLDSAPQNTICQIETKSTYYQGVDPPIIQKKMFFVVKRGRIRNKTMTWNQGIKRLV